MRENGSLVYSINYTNAAGICMFVFWYFTNSFLNFREIGQK